MESKIPKNVDNKPKVHSDTTGPSPKEPSGPQTSSGVATESVPANTTMDILLEGIRIRITQICEGIMKAATAYVEGRLAIQTALKMKSLYENNRPQPHWWNNPRAQELIQSIDNLKAKEEHLLDLKNAIKKEKCKLIHLYDQLCRIHHVFNLRERYENSTSPSPEPEVGKHQVLCMCSYHQAKVLEFLKEINIRVVHVMTSMELVLAADNRSDAAINASIMRQFGEPTSEPPNNGNN